MITYAIVLTALLSGIIGYALHAISEEVYDAIERRKASNREKRESEQMDQAVKLVSEELGGTVLPIDNKVN